MRALFICALLTLTWISQACLVPYDNMSISGEVTLCTGFYDIDDSDQNGVIIIQSNDTFLDCNYSTLSGNNEGYGIYIYSAFNVTIVNCNLANYAEGIYVSGINVSIQRVSVTDCDEGMYIEFSEDVQISDSTASANADTGIVLYSSSNVTIFSSNVSYNDYHTSDTGVYVEGSSNVLILASNISYNGVGVEVWSTDVLIDGCDLSNNVDTGVYPVQSEVEIYNTNLSHVYYGAYAVESNLSIRSSIISNNEYSIYAYYSAVTLHSNMLCYNTLFENFSSVLSFVNNTLCIQNLTPNETVIDHSPQIFQVNVSDPLPGLWCNLSINSSAYTASLDNGTAAFAVNLSDGMYEWSIYCTDENGNGVSSEIRVLRVDSMPPVLRILSPVEGGTYSSDVEVIYTAEDADNCSYQLNDGGWQPLDGNITISPQEGLNKLEICCRSVKHETCEPRNFSFMIRSQVKSQVSGHTGGGGSISLAPSFKINISIPERAIVNESIPLYITISNVGTGSGDYLLTVEIDGKVAEERKIWISAGETKTLSFDLNLPAGKHVVSVNEIRREVVVEREAEMNRSPGWMPSTSPTPPPTPTPTFTSNIESSGENHAAGISFSVSLIPLIMACISAASAITLTATLLLDDFRRMKKSLERLYATLRELHGLMREINVVIHEG